MGEKGCWGEKGCLVAKSGIWGHKGVFGIYLYFFQQKSLGGTKQVPRVPESPV